LRACRASGAAASQGKVSNSTEQEQTLWGFSFDFQIANFGNTGDFGNLFD
jgi:hypothetical protein